MRRNLGWRGQGVMRAGAKSEGAGRSDPGWRGQGAISWVWRGAAGLLLGLLLMAVAVLPAEAQPCTADSQCYNFGQERTYCQGNTLVTRKGVCSGTCRGVEVSRVQCPGPCVGDRCVGGSLTGPRLEPPLGAPGISPVCARICSCNGKKLTYATGYAVRASDCRERTVDCKYGCTCDPEPRCLKR